MHQTGVGACTKPTVVHAPNRLWCIVTFWSYIRKSIQMPEMGCTKPALVHAPNRLWCMHQTGCGACTKPAVRHARKAGCEACTKPAVVHAANPRDALSKLHAVHAPKPPQANQQNHPDGAAARLYVHAIILNGKQPCMPPCMLPCMQLCSQLKEHHHSNML